MDAARTHTNLHLELWPLYVNGSELGRPGGNCSLNCAGRVIHRWAATVGQASDEVVTFEIFPVIKKELLALLDPPVGVDANPIQRERQV